MAPLPRQYLQNENVKFDENTAPKSMSASQNSSYKDVLSQPAPGLSQRQRLLWLQKRRRPGLWVQCDECDKWRYVASVLDRHQLPAKWYCRLNPEFQHGILWSNITTRLTVAQDVEVIQRCGFCPTDKSSADCSVSERPITVRDEEDFIHSEYSAGSVVWARMEGWPWWPAMVDDCPDTEQYYWLDGFSDIPTHYNVVFFDKSDVTRAWLTPEHLKPYSSNKELMTKNLLKNKYYKRIEAAITQADDADQLTMQNRLEKYSFIARYKGQIGTPKKINKEQIRNIQQRMKKRYNIDFCLESSSESEDYDRDVNLSRNAVMLGKLESRALTNHCTKKSNKASGKKSVLNNTVKEILDLSKNNIAEPNSMSAQMGNTERNSEIIHASNSKQSQQKSNIRIPERIGSQLSDDFEF